MKHIFLAFSISLTAGCATMTTPKTPDLFPNSKLSMTPTGQVQTDVDECLALADRYIEQPDQYTNIAKQGLIGGALGAGTGAVAGTITGEVGRGTGAGAAVGGILGVLKGMSEMTDRTPSYERFVEHCLHKKGYEVVGWSSKS